MGHLSAAPPHLTLSCTHCPTTMSHHSLSRIATTLAESNRAFNENSRYFNHVVNQMQEYRNKQNHRDDALNTLHNNRYILNDDNNTTQKLSHPNPGPFTCPTPVFFHIIVEVHPLQGRMGGFSVLAKPKTPDGRDCMMESGQMVVMYPNFTVAWHIEDFIFKERTVRYTATSDEVQAIRYLEIRHDWSLVGFPFNGTLCSPLH
jgi:hypothetical protein